jgi:ferric-dicitrate binding protein FerR (iron transport regulator)
MPDEFDWQLLDRFLAGDASPAEVDQVRAWMSASPERRAMVEALRRDADSRVHVDVNAAWQHLAGRTVRRSRAEWWRNAGWLAAAAVVLIVGSTVSLRMLRKSGAAQQLSNSWQETAAPLGRRLTVTLPDSSTVVLNAGSSLRYLLPFDPAEREVVLRGEGYFTVRHDAARPFRVRANNVNVQDIGTRFVVRAYDAAPTTIVVVVEGAVGVAVADTRDTVVVKPGSLARVTANGAITTGTVDTERFTGFADGLLVLGNLTLAEALPTIERWYDVKIRLTDSSLGRRQLSANFRDEPLAGVLDALSLALDVDTRTDGRDVTISPRKQPK